MPEYTKNYKLIKPLGNENFTKEHQNANMDSIDSNLALKANKAETDTNLALKADKATTYTKTEVDTALSKKADKTELPPQSATTITLAHTKVGTVHNLVGTIPTSGLATIRFSATANVIDGDTFTVNSVAYIAQTTNLEPLCGEYFKAGAVVSCEIDINGTKLNFKSGGAATPKIPSYTGQLAIYGDAKKGYMELLTSGDLTFNSDLLVDLFLVGGGGEGSTGGDGSTGNQGGQGGCGGYTKSLFNQQYVKKQTVAVVIGFGGTTTRYGSATSIGTVTANYGSSGGVGPSTGGSGGGEGARLVNAGRGGYNGSDGERTKDGEGGIGQHTTTKAFGGDVTPFTNMLFSGGGGGGGSEYSGTRLVAGIGGLGGGANGGDYNVLVQAPSANANTGGGGGGGGGISFNRNKGGNGGSGIAIIRWGY